MVSVHKLYVAIAIALCSIVLIFAAHTVRETVRSGEPGTTTFSRDVFLYWISYKVFEEKNNIYDFSLITKKEAEYRQPSGTPMYFLPWNHIILAPIFWNDFETAVYLMVLANLVLFIVATICALKILAADPPLPPFLVALSSLAFFPALDAINFGQLGIIVTAALYCSLYFIKKRSDWIAGIILLPVLLKPHLIYLVLIAGGIWIIRHRRWKIARGFLVAFTFLTAITFYASPQSFSWWLNSDSSALIWQGASLVTPLRLIIEKLTGHNPTWPAYVVPIVASLGTILWLTKIPLEKFKLESILAPLLCLSILTTPYNFIFDHVVLLFAYLLIISQAFSALQRKDYFPSATIILLQGLLIALHFKDIMDWRLFWYPGALLMFMIWQSRETSRRLEN